MTRHRERSSPVAQRPNGETVGVASRVKPFVPAWQAGHPGYNPAMSKLHSRPVAAPLLGQAVAAWLPVCVRLRIAAVIAFALLTAIGAQIAVPLPGTPVPLTLQTLFVLLAGATLGPRLGMLSMTLYLVLGLTGYHAFALGSLGLAKLCGPTGGYLVGFVLAQPTIGLLTGSGRVSWLRMVAAMLAGQDVIFTAGMIWLSACLGCGLWTTLALGLWPFLPGLILKTAVAAALAQRFPPLTSLRRAINAG